MYYEIDERNLICHVGGDWDNSAIDHSSDECVSKYVIGTNLFRYISDDPTKMWMRAIIDLVRLTKTTNVQSYRCDTPSSRRQFLQTIELIDQNHIRVSHELLIEEAMQTSVRVNAADPGQSPVQRCSVCNNIQQNGQWVDPFAVGRDVDLRVVHTVCPNCKRYRNEP